MLLASYFESLSLRPLPSTLTTGPDQSPPADFLTAISHRSIVNLNRPQKRYSGALMFHYVNRISRSNSTHTSLLFSLLLLIAGCSSESSELDSIANQLNEAVNRCMIDVRDRQIKYETSENCRGLSRIARQYISAGGLKDNAPARADRIAERARARAWMALAISKTGDPHLSIW